MYLLQESTLRIVEKLRALAPDREFSGWFAQIIADGTGKTFAMEDNEKWLQRYVGRFSKRFSLQILSGNGCEIWPQSETSSAIDAKRLGCVALFVIISDEVRFGESPKQHASRVRSPDAERLDTARRLQNLRGTSRTFPAFQMIIGKPRHVSFSSRGDALAMPREPNLAFPFRESA